MNKKIFFNILLIFAVTILFPVHAMAATKQSAVATGSYQNPFTGIIEDSGGADNEALGSSMVQKMVDSTASFETTDNNEYYATIRFNLMNNISDVKLSIEDPGSTSWEYVSYEASIPADDQTDFRLPVYSKDTVIKAECMVDAMGRYVIFFVKLSDFGEEEVTAATSTTTVEGNTEETSEPAKTDITVNTLASKQQSVDEILETTEGLIIGEEVTNEEITDEDVAKADTVDEETVIESVQELSIPGEFYVLLFLVVFSASILSHFAFWGIKLLFTKPKKKKRYYQTSYSEEEDDMDIDLDFLEEENED